MPNAPTLDAWLARRQRIAESNIVQHANIQRCIHGRKAQIEQVNGGWVGARGICGGRRPREPIFPLDIAEGHGVASLQLVDTLLVVLHKLGAEEFFGSPGRILTLGRVGPEIALIHDGDLALVDAAVHRMSAQNDN